MLQLCIASFFVATSTSINTVSPNYDHLKSLEWAQGIWRREWTTKKDSPNLKKGQKVAKEWHFYWTPGKNALVIRQVIQSKGELVGRMDALFGWDKRRQEIVGSGFASNGGAGSGWTIVSRKNQFTISVGASDWIFSKKGNDRLTVTDASGAVREFRRVKKK